MTEELDKRQVQKESRTNIKIEMTDSLHIDYLNDNWKERRVNRVDWLHIKEIKSDQDQHIHYDERLQPEEYNYSNLCSYDSKKSKNISDSVNCNYENAYVTNLNDSRHIHTEEKLSIRDHNIKDAKNPYLLLGDHNHTKHKYFQCTDGDVVTKQIYNADHRRIHSEETPLECTECDFKPTEKRYLVEDKRTHKGENHSVCSECGFKPARKRDLGRHKLIHTGEKPFMCAECGFKTAHKEVLVTHNRIHTGEKPFVCTECNFKTAQRRNLVRHKDIHSGDKPFQCMECDFKTARKGNLVRHKQSHTREKHIVCSECDFKTGERADWWIHKQTHNEEKPSYFTEYNETIHSSTQNDVILQKQAEDKDDSNDILELEGCTEQIKLEISESQLLIDNQWDIKTEPINIH